MLFDVALSVHFAGPNRYPTSCIERISRGEIWANPAHSVFLVEALKSTPSCEGIEAGNEQIADRLGLSEHPVKNYLFHVFEKLGVSNRMELLFLLFKCHVQAASPGGLENDRSQPIGAYLKASEEGVVAAQFIVGLGHLEGYGIEKNERSAYYWLRMAEENSAAVEQRTHALLEKLRSTLKADDIDAVERTVATWVQENKLLRSNALPNSSV